MDGKSRVWRLSHGACLKLPGVTAKLGPELAVYISPLRYPLVSEFHAPSTLDGFSLQRVTVHSTDERTSNLMPWAYSTPSHFQPLQLLQQSDRNTMARPFAVVDETETNQDQDWAARQPQRRTVHIQQTASEGPISVCRPSWTAARMRHHPRARLAREAPVPFSQPIRSGAMSCALTKTTRASTLLRCSYFNASGFCKRWLLTSQVY